MKLLVSALEHSANVHLEALCRELPESVELRGIFSSDLGDPIVDLRALAVMGFVDALKKLPFFLKLGRKMTDLAADADKVLLMDSSGFNLPLAKKIKKRYPDKEIIYYILPQAWAWRKGRIPVLARTCDRLLSILPFEAKHYPPDAPIEYVGHPLLDEIKKVRESIPEEKGRKIAFLPGSRPGEIRRLMPDFHRVRAALNPQEALLVVPPYFDEVHLGELYGDLSDFRVVHDAHEALYSSDFAFVCSGTATLEAALIGIPFVLAYRGKALDIFLARTLTDLEYAGLANIFSLDFQGCPMHPELIQEELSTESLLQAYEEFDRERYFADVLKLREYLGTGSSRRVAEILTS